MSSYLATIVAIVAIAFSCFTIFNLWRGAKSLDKTTRMLEELERRIRDGR